MLPPIACLLLLSCAFTINAQSQTMHVIGAGTNVSCGTWFTSRRSNEEFSMQNWALGFMSGAEVFGEVGNILGNTDADGVAYWLDRYCSQHPASPFFDAVKAFIQERRAR